MKVWQTKCVNCKFEGTNLQGSSGGSFENLPDALLAFGGALEVGKGIDLLRHRPPLLWLHWLLLHLP